MHNWQEEGGHGIVPVREQLKLDKLKNIFTEIFPQITLSFDLKSKKISCSKNNSEPYNLNQLSDGEKQVLSLITDISILGEPNSIIIVDEPELNLNSLLAVRLWNSLEEELEDSTFLYATHDIGFCIRDNVEKIYVLSEQNNLIDEITNVKNVEANELRAFLGSIPAILSTNAAIITEGKSDSIDAIFYRWIAGNNSIETVAMGSATDVIAVSSRQGIWEVVAPMVKLIGIIDRDYKPDDIITKLRSDNTVILKFHEVESYLCLPEVVIRVAKSIGLVAKLPTKEAIENLIMEEFKKDILKIAAQRVFQKSKLHISISIQRQLLSRLKTVEEIEIELIKEAEKQSQFVKEQFNQELISKSLREEIALCEKAIADNNYHQILTLIPGKSLLEKIFPLTGARNALDFARACSNHIKIEEIPDLAELKELISKINQ